jgi:hypothetical protein
MLGGLTPAAVARFCSTFSAKKMSPMDDAVDADGGASTVRLLSGWPDVANAKLERVRSPPSLLSGDEKTSIQSLEDHLDTPRKALVRSLRARSRPDPG